MKEPSILIETGLKAIDMLFPQGFPRGSFILISGEAGTGKTILAYSIAKAYLRRNEYCIFVTLDEPPSIIEENVLLSSGQNSLRKLTIIDCFSFRSKSTLYLRESDVKYSTKVIYVSNPRDIKTLQRIIYVTAKSFSTPSKGLIVVDSLTELISLCDANSFVEFVKMLRSLFAREMGVTVIGTLTFGIKLLEGLDDLLDYVADIIIDMRYEPEYMRQGLLIRQLRIRKARGCPHDTRWLTFNVEDGELSPVEIQGKDYLSLLSSFSRMEPPVE